MSLIFLIILVVVLVVDFLLALFGGLRSEGKEKLLRLLQRYGLILGGYAAVALIAFFGGKLYPNMEYISGLLLDPIFRYSVSLLDKLKTLMTRPKKEDKADKTEKTEKAEKTEAAPAPEAKVETKKDPVMIEIAPAEDKPKTRSRAKKVTK